MNWRRRFDQSAESFSDRLNPLLVKEVRQALKGRVFLFTFGWLLLGAWVVSTFGVTSAGDAIQWQSSPWLLGYYVVALQIAVVGLVPFMAFRSMQVESEANTWELVCITTLSPRRLVGGKLGCAVVQMLLLSSVVAPCIAFCSLLPGFDLILTVTALGVTLVLSLLTIIFSVMISSLASTRYWQNVSMGALLLLLAGETKVVCELTYIFVTGQDVTQSVRWYLERFAFGGAYWLSPYVASPSGHEYWLILGALLVMALAYFFLFYEITVSQVTFEADSRSGRIRVTCSLLYFLQWCLLILCDSRSSYFISNPALGLFVAHWLVFGLSACLESETISTRIRRQLPGWSLLRLPYLPGGSRAMVFLLLHLGSTPFVAMLAKDIVPNFWSGTRVTLWSMYLMVYVTLAVACCRSILAMNPVISRASLRVGVVIGIVVSMLPTIVLSQMVDNVAYRFFLLTIFNPFEYTALDGAGWTMVTPIMLVVLIGVHLNWEIIKRSVQDVTPVELPDSGHWLQLPTSANRRDMQ